MAELGIDSARELARRANVNRGTVNAFLAGERWPQPAKRIQLDKALGWEPGRIDELFGGPSRTTGRIPLDPGQTPDPTQMDAPDPSRDLVGFLKETERDLSDAERKLWELEIRAYAVRRAMEIRGDI
jgi:transcriptional regulator with XRE-family HTH domain